MSDQLTLHLEPALPRLPASLRPMLPRGTSAPFDSPDHLFEPHWAGERALAFVGDPAGSLRLVDRQGHDLATTAPDLTALPERIAARSAVLDGELVVVDRAGRADPRALAERLAGRPGPSLAYLVFDLLDLDGRPLLGIPLERRRAELVAAIVPGAEVIAVPAIAGDGIALHAAVMAQGIAGVMARDRRSPYLPGIRSRLWRFVPAAASGQPAAASGQPAAASGQPAPAEQAAALTGAGPATEPEAAEPPAADGLAGAGTAGARWGPTGPVLALIRRLPFDDLEG